MLSKQEIKCNDRVMILEGMYSACTGIVFGTVKNLTTGKVEDVMVEIDQLDYEHYTSIENVRKLN